MNIRKKFATLILASLSAIAVSQTAYDDATHSVYNDGWQTGDNGGYGWAQWNHAFSPSGFATANVGDSNTNGSGGGPSINTGGRAWQHHANSPDWVETSRATVGAAGMFGGYRMSIEWDNGILANGYQRAYFFGVSATFFFVYASAGVSTYRLDLPSGTNIDTNILVNDGGMIFSIQDNANGTYTGRLSAKQAGNGSDYVWSGALTTAIRGFGVTNYRGGPTAANDMYVNSCKIEAVPEPGSLLAISTGTTLALVRKRKKSK